MAHRTPASDNVAYLPARIRAAYAAGIKTALGKSVEGFIEAGNELIEAKEGRNKLPHGEFGAMIEKDLNLSWRTVNRLMEIARHPVLSNWTHVSNLPPSWGTLYELTKLDHDALAGALKDGTINPRTERKDVAKMLAQEHAAPLSGTRARVADVGKKHDGVTFKTLQDALPGIHPGTVKSALDTMIKQGWFIDSGRREKTSQGGRPATVYTIAEIPVPRIRKKNKTKAEPEKSADNPAPTTIDPEDSIKSYRALVAKTASTWSRDRRIREVDALVKALDLNIRDWVSYVSFGKRK